MPPRSARTTQGQDSDPIAYRSGALCEAINKDAPTDGIRALAQWAGKVDRPPKEARLVKIDARGFSVEYTVIAQFLRRNKPQTVRIEYDVLPSAAPEGRGKRRAVVLKDAQEVKGVVFGLAEHAVRQVGFPAGSLPRSEVSRYETQVPVLYAPSMDALVPFFVLLSALVLYTPVLRETLLSEAFRAYLVDKAGGEKGVETARWAFTKVAQVHAVEACIMSTITVRRGASPRLALAWVVSTAFVGFTSFYKFFKLNPLPLRYKTK